MNTMNPPSLTRRSFLHRTAVGFGVSVAGVFPEGAAFVPEVPEAGAAAAFNASMIDDRDVDPLGDMDLYAAQVAAMDLVIGFSNATFNMAAAAGAPRPRRPRSRAPRPRRP